MTDERLVLRQRLALLEARLGKATRGSREHRHLRRAHSRVLNKLLALEAVRP